MVSDEPLIINLFFCIFALNFSYPTFVDGLIPIRILLASDQFLVLQGLRSLIEQRQDFVFAGEATSTEDLKLKANELRPNLIILDKNFGNFFDETELEKNAPLFAEHKVLLFSEMDKEWIYRNHKLGITGFVTTISGMDEIVEAIYSCSKGIRYFSPKIVEVLIELSFRNAPEKESKLHESLSDREMEIFKMVTAGRTTKEIAEALFLSPHTVYTHRKNILKKLSCKSATDLLNYAYAQGLVDPEAN